MRSPPPLANRRRGASDERVVAGVAQPPGHERWEAPSPGRRVERVRRRADVTPWASRSWSIHASAPSGRAADGEVADEGARRRGLGGVGQFGGQAPLDPGDELVPGGQRRVDQASGDALGSRVADVVRPGVASPVRAPRPTRRTRRTGSVRRRAPRPSSPAFVIALGLELLGERMALGRPHRIAIDPSAGGVVDGDRDRAAQRQQQRVQPAARAG